jgi:glucose/mannose-6-phosphate isomerase
VASVGEGRLARLASLVQFGDYLSLYLALMNGVDPTSIASIDDFKRRLAQSARRDA